MIKQIKLQKADDTIIAMMNDTQLFKVSITDKSINIEQLYKDMSISKDDEFQNKIEEGIDDNKSAIDVLYDNVKIFLDELIKKISDVLVGFDSSKEENLLETQ
ncbi:MAG: hypothetical protein K2M08_01705 [Anaeroplasmataceae bacterium]|nr:hypothetical protein [Anaeroplasmataceae bacterium]